MSVERDRASTVRCFLLIVLLSGLTLSLNGCKSIEAAQKQSVSMAAELHKEINDADYDAIYLGADQAFRDETSAADSQQIFKGVHDKLGQANSSELQNIRVMANTNGQFITAEFTTNFANDGGAHEEIGWRKDGDLYRLYRYNINSKAFLR